MSASPRPSTRAARQLRIRGTVQGVGFRPFVLRTAVAHALAGWVRNDADGVDVFVEGEPADLSAFALSLRVGAPPLSRIDVIEQRRADLTGALSFEIRDSGSSVDPTVPIAPDAAICADCLRELRDPLDRRAGYPFINCTNCGPRYSIIEALPFDRRHTTMASWRMCDHCRREYESPQDRRFHAQANCCPACGPHCRLEPLGGGIAGVSGDREAIAAAAACLRQGRIVAIKGLGGYHLACDARDAAVVQTLRARKFRKERPFALMVRELSVARSLVDLSPQMVALLRAAARPIVLAPARVMLDGVAPQTGDLGVMLPYTPIQHLLFDAGAPDVLVMTSANRSSEPIAYEDDEARDRLRGIADAILVGERRIARRVDDSVVQSTIVGPQVLRRARGQAPAIVVSLDTQAPTLATGGDLKGAVALAVDGQVLVSQHLGDLEHLSVRDAFDRAVSDLLAMYHVDRTALTVVHDLHPAYVSTALAHAIGAARVIGVQHHRAHISSVLAERREWNARVLGLAFDGTGYGDDGAIWGGEVFAGSLRGGLGRVAHLRQARLPGGDAAALFPVQAAAGFLEGIEIEEDDLVRPPFELGTRFAAARRLLASNTRSFPTTSMGRLFDTAAALTGFTRGATFEGQAAMWLEQLARRGTSSAECPFAIAAHELDYRPALSDLIRRRRRGESPATLALAFHAGLATGVARLVSELRHVHAAEAIVLSGGVFQNRLLLELLCARLLDLPVWTPIRLPPNDGGLALGQIALVCHRMTTRCEGSSPR